MCLALPALVVEVGGESAELRWAWADFSGLRRRVSLACVDAAPGDYVLVHAGMALAAIDREEAERLLAWATALDVEEHVPQNDEQQGRDHALPG
jgi:hydrogenase expression/formation protein HypC